MEHIALYRQFRPMTFDEIVEQKGPVSALRQSVLTKKIGHAYLFSGQRGTGKTSIAKVFSRAINCENPTNGNPCNECAICKGIITGSLMDVIEIDAASNNSVDNIRRICEEVNFAPAKAQYKVYIIDEVHMLSTGAFNALLKTLEEPPKHVVFLLATTEPHRIPATIHSRCQRYDFKRISIDSIVKRLQYICNQEGFKATEVALRLIASLSDGAMRDAISLLDQAGNSNLEKSITRDVVLSITGTVDDAFLGKMAQSLIAGDYESIITMSEELANSGRDITRFSVDLAQYFRDLLVVRMMPDPTKLVKVQTATLKTMYEICQNVAAETLVAFISKLSAMISDLKWTPSVRTTFEITLIQLCGRKVKVDPVPLVIPDFVTKQQAFAASVSVPADEIINSVVAEAASVQNEPAPVASVVVETPAPAPVVETVKAEPEKTEIPTVETVTPVVEEKAIEVPVAPATPVVEEKKEETKAPSIESPFNFWDDLTPPPADDSDIPAYSIDNIVPVESAIEEPLLSSVQKEDTIIDAPVSAPAVEPENPEMDPEDIPMENQIDLFSLPIAPAPVVEEPESKPATQVKAPVSVPVEPEIPVFTIPDPEPSVEEEKESEPVAPTMPKGSLLASLSASFLDDIDIPASSSDDELKISSYDKSSEAPLVDDMGDITSNVTTPSEPAAPFWSPAATSPKREAARTSLAAVTEGTELLISKEPAVAEIPTDVPLTAEPRADLQMIWESIYAPVAKEDYQMFVKLYSTKLQMIKDSVYIVFDNSYSNNSFKELTEDPLYKKIRSDIIAVLPETKHVYMATERQYAKVLETNGMVKPNINEKQETKLDMFINKVKQQPEIDLKFGDD